LSCICIIRTIRASQSGKAGSRLSFRHLR
jgi:hypothetical protein